MLFSFHFQINNIFNKACFQHVGHIFGHWGYRKNTEPLNHSLFVLTCITSFRYLSITRNSFIAFIMLRVIASCLCREGKQGIKSKAGALKCCKETKLLTLLMSGVKFHFQKYKLVDGWVVGGPCEFWVG